MHSSRTVLAVGNCVLRMPLGLVVFGDALINRDKFVLTRHTYPLHSFLTMSDSLVPAEQSVYSFVHRSLVDV